MKLCPKPHWIPEGKLFKVYLGPRCLLTVYQSTHEPYPWIANAPGLIYGKKLKATDAEGARAEAKRLVESRLLLTLECVRALEVENVVGGDVEDGTNVVHGLPAGIDAGVAS